MGIKFGGLPRISASKDIGGFKFGSLVRYYHSYILIYETDFNLVVVGVKRQCAKFLIPYQISGYMVLPPPTPQEKFLDRTLGLISLSLG